MGIRARLSILFLIGLMALTLSGPGKNASAAASSVWQISTIDAPLNINVGDMPSLALQPGTQKPFISYYDWTHGDLKLAFPVSAAGDCGPSNAWSCNSLHRQNTENYGMLSSMAFNGQGQWGISYISPLPLGTLNFRGIPGISQSELYFESVNNQAGFSGHSNSAFRFDSNGLGHIAFITLDSQTHPVLRYATSRGTGGGGNCGVNGDWDCETLFQVSFKNDIGPVDLFFNGLQPLIVYSDIYQNLNIAVYYPGFGNCGVNNDWRCNIIDSSVYVDGDIAASSSSPSDIGIVYYDDLSHTLHYAYTVNSGGNCGWGDFAGKFKCVTVDSVGDSSTSLTLRASLAPRLGQPFISYIDIDDQSNPILKVAYPQTGGNCGDTVMAFQCEVMDAGGAAQNAVESPSMAIDPNGTAYIAYYNATLGQLKLAVSQPYAVFLPALRK